MCFSLCAHPVATAIWLAKSVRTGRKGKQSTTHSFTGDLWTYEFLLFQEKVTEECAPAYASLQEAAEEKKKQACTVTASRAAPELVAARLISSTSSASLQGLQVARTLVSAEGMGELKLGEPEDLAEYVWLQQEMLSVADSVSCQEKE